MLWLTCPIGLKYAQPPTRFLLTVSRRKLREPPHP